MTVGLALGARQLEADPPPRRRVERISSSLNLVVVNLAMIVGLLAYLAGR